MAEHPKHWADEFARKITGDPAATADYFAIAADQRAQIATEALRGLISRHTWPVTPDG